MAVMSDADRAGARRDVTYDRDWPGTIPLIKAEMRAAVDAADDWVDANQVSYNNALPTAAKTQLTAAQKALLLAVVLRKRFGAGV